MNVQDRFDGHVAWIGLSGPQQEVIGTIVLELLAAWYVEDTCDDPFEHGNPLLRAASAADVLLIGQLREALVDAVPRDALEVDGQPRLPSLLGPVCRECGCSQEDGCDVGCGWIAEDLCSACGGAS